MLCVELQARAVEVELDASAALSLIVSNAISNGDLSVLVDDCRDLLLPPQVKVSHCFREANLCADALARLGSSWYKKTESQERGKISQREKIEEKLSVIALIIKTECTDVYIPELITRIKITNSKNSTLYGFNLYNQSLHYTCLYT